MKLNAKRITSDGDEEMVYIWSDGTWCYSCDYESEMAQHMSDDYIITWVAQEETENIDQETYNMAAKAQGERRTPEFSVFGASNSEFMKI